MTPPTAIYTTADNAAWCLKQGDGSHITGILYRGTVGQWDMTFHHYPAGTQTGRAVTRDWIRASGYQWPHRLRLD